MSVIDLDAAPGPQDPRPAAARVPISRRTPAVRLLVMLALALAAGLPQGTAPVPFSGGRPLPLPSYCTGIPRPGGRLNIVRNDTYILLDATTGTVLSTGRCPHGTGTRSNTGN
nr:hypothetical protein GCM10020063_014730 [Dactylosporangium thailandense]